MARRRKRASDLDEQLDFAKRRLLAYKNVVETYDRKVRELDDEQRQLDERRRLLETAKEEAPGMIAKSHSEILRLTRARSQREASWIGGGGTKSKTRRLLDRRRRLVEKLRALEEELAKSNSKETADA